jgi:type III secretion protein U
MSGQGSEERPLPASKKKLDDARKKGQVATSRDMVGGAGLAFVLGGVLLGAGGAIGAATSMFDAAGEGVAMLARGEGLAPGMERSRQAIGDAAFATALPAMGLALTGALLAGLAVLRGVPFSADPVKPRLEKLNPVEGFKRLFSIRALVELVKSLVKAVLLALLLVVLLAGGLGALVAVPACGMPCVQGVVAGLGGPMLAAAALLFLVAGLADVGLQAWLFRRDMRMSVTEQKRERKEMEGDPQLRNARRRLMREAAALPRIRLGLDRATLLLAGEDAAIGLRFVRGETPVPIVVARAEGPRASSLRSQAAAAGIRVAEEPELVAGLIRRAPPGSPIPQDSFTAVAGALVRAGAL